MNRQTAWQLKRKEAGICARCGKEPLINKNHGELCRAIVRVYNNERAKQRRTKHEGTNTGVGEITSST